MIEELTPEQRAALDSVKASRGACPSAGTLIEYEALDANARGRHAAHDHIAICSRCQLVLLHAAEPAPAIVQDSRLPLRWMLPLAAITVLAVGITLFLPNFTSNVPPETVRGTEIVATAPIGSVEAVAEFAWQSPLAATRYRLTVMRGAKRVWQAETTALRINAPAGLLRANVEYRWSVEAIDNEGEIRMTSPPRAFMIGRAP